MNTAAKIEPDLVMLEDNQRSLKTLDIRKSVYCRQRSKELVRERNEYDE